MMDFKTPPRSRYHDPRPLKPVASEAPPEREAPAPKRRVRRPAAGPRNWKKIAASLLLAAVIAVLAYGYLSTKNQLEQSKNSAGATQTESQQLINKVGQLVDLPSGETPTIATVNDASKLKDQPFFANARNGDKVLIYSKSGKAVLYRPSTNKVIEYSKVNLGSSPAQ
jgi:hypothetical protein